MSHDLILNRGYEENINNNAPIRSGAISFTEDGQNLYLDSNDESKRIKITDIILLNKIIPSTCNFTTSGGIKIPHLRGISDSGESLSLRRYYSYKYEIMPNSIYYITGSTAKEDIGSQSEGSKIVTLPLCIYYDENDEIISIENLGVTLQIDERLQILDYKITTPKNAKYIAINKEVNHVLDIYTYTNEADDYNVMFFPNKLYICNYQLKRYDDQLKQLITISDLNNHVIESTATFEFLNNVDATIQIYNDANIFVQNNAGIGSFIIDTNGCVGIVTDVKNINNELIASCKIITNTNNENTYLNYDIYFDSNYEGIEVGTIDKPFSSWNNIISDENVYAKLQSDAQQVTIHILSNAILTIENKIEGINNVKFLGYNSDIDFINTGSYAENDAYDNKDCAFLNCKDLIFESINLLSSNSNNGQGITNNVAFSLCDNVKINNCLNAYKICMELCENVIITNSQCNTMKIINSENVRINNSTFDYLIFDESKKITCYDVISNIEFNINNKDINDSNLITTLIDTNILGKFNVNNVNQLNLISGYCNSSEVALIVKNIYLGTFDLSKIENLTINEKSINEYPLNNNDCIIYGSLNSLQVYDDTTYSYENTGSTLKEHLTAISNKFKNVFDSDSTAGMTTIDNINKKIDDNTKEITKIKTEDIVNINKLINDIKNGVKINDFKTVENELEKLDKLLKDSDGNLIDIVDIANKVKELNNMINGNEMAGHWLITTQDNEFVKWTVPKTGEYQIIVVGSGGNADMYEGSSSSNVRGGGSGGISIATKSLNKGEQYYLKTLSTLVNGNTKEPTGYSVFSSTTDIGKTTADTSYTINTSTLASCETSIDQYVNKNSANICIIAYNGNSGTAGNDSSDRKYGSPGVAFGGDNNYRGNYSTANIAADVGAYIPYLMKKNTRDVYDSDINSGNSTVRIESGYGILGHGCATGWYQSTSRDQTYNKGGCILIIPKD